MIPTQGDSLYDPVHHLTDEAWFDMLIRSLESPNVDGIRLPGFPDTPVQQLTNQKDGATTLQKAFHFYQVAREVLVYMGGNT